MCEDDTTEDITEINPECPDGGDPVRIETPPKSSRGPQPAVDYHRPVALDPPRAKRFERK